MLLEYQQGVAYLDSGLVSKPGLIYLFAVEEGAVG